VILGFELRALHLVGWCSKHLSQASSHFYLVILEIGSCFLPRSAWTIILLFMLSAIAGISGRNHHSQLFPLRWGLTNFFFFLLWLTTDWTTILPSS
jgi:hypothetical protein